MGLTFALFEPVSEAVWAKDRTFVGEERCEFTKDFEASMMREKGEKEERKKKDPERLFFFQPCTKTKTMEESKQDKVLKLIHQLKTFQDTSLKQFVPALWDFETQRLQYNQKLQASKPNSGLGSKMMDHHRHPEHKHDLHRHREDPSWHHSKSFFDDDVFSSVYVDSRKAEDEYDLFVDLTKHHTSEHSRCGGYPPLLIRFSGPIDQVVKFGIENGYLYIPEDVDLVHGLTVPTSVTLPHIVLTFHAASQAIIPGICDIHPTHFHEVQHALDLLYAMKPRTPDETFTVETFISRFNYLRTKEETH